MARPLHLKGNARVVRTKGRFCGRQPADEVESILRKALIWRGAVANSRRL
jgi:hypothetical protein